MIADRLCPFGFVKGRNGYAYHTLLADGQFEMTVTIAEDGNVSAAVADSASKEPYVLHCVPDAQGAFVGRIREEYERVLTSIAENCCEKEVFKSACAREIITHIRERYQDELQFLWTKFPDNAIFRRQDNAKWYAALLIVQKRKLGLDQDGSVEIVDLRCAPEAIDVLIDRKKYFPGYHMNKKHWLTILLDGSVPVDAIFRHISTSYDLAGK